MHKGSIITERFKENQAGSDYIMTTDAGRMFTSQMSNPIFAHGGMSYRLDICFDALMQTDTDEYDIHLAICSRMRKDLFVTPRPRPRMHGIFILVDNKEDEQQRRLGIAMTRQLPEGKRHYHMPLVAQSYDHTDVFEVEL